MRVWRRLAPRTARLHRRADDAPLTELHDDGVEQPRGTLLPLAGTHRLGRCGERHLPLTLGVVGDANAHAAPKERPVRRYLDAWVAALAERLPRVHGGEQQRPLA